VVPWAARDRAGQERWAPPAVVDYLTALAEWLDVEYAWFVPADSSAPPARSRPGHQHWQPTTAEIDDAATRWLGDGHAEGGTIAVGERSVAFYGVQSGSGDLRGALGLFPAIGVAARPMAELAAALLCPVVDSPHAVSARQELVDWAATRAGGRAAFAISIDELGVANEVLGFHAGDVLLEALEARILRWAGPAGRVATGGGARYIAIRTDIDDDAQAVHEAERLLALIAEAVDVDGLPVSRSASIGVAVDAVAALGPEVLLASAVRCGATARAAGGDRFELYDDSATSALLDRLRLGLELYGALLDGQLRMHYQPEFDLVAGSIVAVEALLRWQHPVLGLLQAESFVPDAEQTHTFAAVQRWVIDEACRQLAQWRKTGIADSLLLRMNIPGHLAVEADTDAALRSAFTRHDVPANRVCIELTERRMPADLSALAAQLHRWHELGAVIALDDFGVGEGTLTHLLALPIDLVKIDQSFVVQMSVDERAGAVVAGVIALAHSLHLGVVAEGIDGPDAAAALVRLGCTRGQGNALAAAMEPADIGALLESQR
jgi:EAL domain-containing protein (putative c-di-GMP-specific phosphodiesterase class I)/GGDEF domain-containing protein